VQIKIPDAATRFLKDNATTVLTAGGVAGTVATAVLSFRAGTKYERIIHDAEVQRTAQATADGPGPLTVMDKAKLVGVHVIPPVAAVGVTIGCIIMSHRMSATKAAALAAAYGVSKKELEEYKAKLEEKLGVQKTEKAKAEMAQKRVNDNPPPSSTTFVLMGEDVICYDKTTDRYFRSTMEKLRRAELATNNEIARYGSAKAQHFYSELELEPTTLTQNAGWSRQIELEVSHAFTPDERPCITIDFDHLPDPNYQMDYS
jgi:hypothetical protein